MSEKKFHKMLLVKYNVKKPTSRTKAAMREAAEQLTPSEQLDLLFCQIVVESGNDPESSESEDSSLDGEERDEMKEFLFNDNEEMCVMESLE